MAFQLFAAAGLRILTRRVVAATWATDGKQLTCPDLFKIISFCMHEGLKLGGSGIWQLYKVSSRPPSSP